MILALDTSTLTTSLALVRADGSVVAQAQLPPPARQSAVLPQALAELVSGQGVTLAQLSGFVVGLGPGSFTGLRIGLATVKGLAYALARPVAGASSLAAVALEGPRDVELLCVAVVKKGELYLGRYRTDGRGVTALSPEGSLTVAQVAQLVAATPGARVLGPALGDYRDALVTAGAPAGQLLDGVALPSAAALARLARLPAKYRKEDVFALEPHYLRGSGAEENPKFPPLPGAPAQARLKDERDV